MAYGRAEQGRVAVKARSRRVVSRTSKTARARAELAIRLAGRRAEIEDAALARARDIADPADVGDLSYVESLRAAASEAVDFGLAALGSSQDRLPLVPPALLSQARLAARSGVGLDTVLRRYAAGHALLVDFLVDEVERDRTLAPAELRKLLALGSSALDRLLTAVSEEYGRELECRSSFSRKRRLAERVERLLAGEPVDASDLPYDFSGWHLAIVAQGGGARQQVRALVADLNCLSLLVSRDGGQVWAWLGSRAPLDPAQILSSADPSPDMIVAVGEPADDLSGWRLTHRQASAALTVALRGEQRAVRYVDVALMAAALGNDVLLRSLNRLYLDPLAAERDGGEILRRTLSVYFEVGGNVSSVAAALGVSRRTIRNRLERVEQLIGRSCQSAAAELHTALRLYEHL
jgi:hypothetical protein